MNKTLPSTNKIHCEDCKTDIPKALWPKHQFCQRHLRARAAGLFYKKRKGASLETQAKKRLKEDPDALFDDPRFEMMGFEPEEVKKSDLVMTKSRVKGVWVFIEDQGTGATYYKNKLSGKIQRTKPIGLREEDVEVEVINTAGEERPSVVPGSIEEDPEEEAKPGDWQDVQAAYWFGGSDKEDSEPDPSIKPFFAAGDVSEDSAESASSESAEISRKSDPSEESETEKTFKFRTEEEQEDAFEAIVPKPTFQHIGGMTASSTFQKRTKKSEFRL